MIAGTRHDMIMVGVGINKKYFTCDITNTCPVIHQNHDYNNRDTNKLNNLMNNNFKCRGSQKSVVDSPYKSVFSENTIKFIKK